MVDTAHALVSDASGQSNSDTGIPGAARGLPALKLRRVAEYVDAHFHRALRLPELSAVVHMSPYHFARLFKQSTGESPHRFVVRRRIAKAIALLATPGLSIRAVAAAVGFRTSAHFATTFRRMTGVTPSEQRRADQLQIGLSQKTPSA